MMTIYGFCHMKKNILLFASVCLLSCSLSLAQSRTSTREDYAREVLARAQSKPNYSTTVSTVSDSTSFISAIEPLLFVIYGRDQISHQRPYGIFHIGKYWIATGTMHEPHPGGTFEIVYDERRARVIYIMHGK
jgi:hypothetical protein